MKKIILLCFILFIAVQNISFSQWTKAVIAVTGNIHDEITKTPLSVEIGVYDNTGKKIKSTKSNSYEEGYYYVTGLIPGSVYSFEVTSENHLKEWLTISVPNSDKYLEISNDFNLKPKASNTLIPLSVSPFEFNKSKLKFGSEVALEPIAATLKNNPETKFTILSYPDNNEDPAENLKLTKQRADVLFDYLVVKGIDPRRMQIQASNTIDPKTPPPTEKRAKGKKYIGTTYLKIN